MLAKAGEILVSDASACRAAIVVDDLEQCELELKGGVEPMRVRVLRVRPSVTIAAAISS